MSGAAGTGGAPGAGAAPGSLAAPTAHAPWDGSVEHRVAVDATRTVQADPGSGHNRWHPDVPPLLAVAPGVAVMLECRNGVNLVLPADGTDVTAAAVLAVDMGDPHAMTGPVFVEGAAPGDLLAVEILRIDPGPRGLTPLFPGFGGLADLFPEAHCVNWTLAGGVARSRELPGVAVPADCFPGVIGVAPSRERLAAFAAREAALAATGAVVADVAPARAVPPWAADGLRTIPPRETGGNMDTKGLVEGSTAWFPVEVPGALFSVGDLHFAQGDGEVCGTAIEMDGAITVRFRVERGGSAGAWRPRFPAYRTPALATRRGRPEFATTGLPIRDDGSNADMDLTLATRNALVEMLGWLTATRGLTPQAAYALMGAVCDVRASEIVDVPNVLVSAVVPLDIFEG